MIPFFRDESPNSAAVLGLISRKAGTQEIVLTSGNRVSRKGCDLSRQVATIIVLLGGGVISFLRDESLNSAAGLGLISRKAETQEIVLTSGNRVSTEGWDLSRQVATIVVLWGGGGRFRFYAMNR